jgi:serine/threonine protein kinase
MLQAPDDATRVILGDTAPTLIMPRGGFPAAASAPDRLPDVVAARTPVRAPIDTGPTLIAPQRPPLGRPAPPPPQHPASPPRDGLAPDPFATSIHDASDWKTPGAALYPPLDPLPRGHVLHGRYEILKPLARGGFSLVYLGQHQRTGSLVAIKEACPNSGLRRADGSIEADPLSLARHREMLITEIVAIAKSSHPGVVRIEDAFEANGTIFLVMEYVEGESLSKMQGRRGRLSLPSVQKLAGQLIDAMSHLHAGDTLHGDIKPSNIIVRPSLAPVLIDFGTALRLSDAVYAHPVASPGYSAPERLGAAGDIGPWSDIYSLGATLCAVLTGEAPTNLGFNPGLLPSIPDGDGDAGDFIEGLRAALARDPATRPQTAADLARALNVALPEQEAKKATAPACSLFISYAHRDAEIIEPLVKSLQSRGVNLWIDRSGIQPGQAWAREITRGLRSARIVLVFSSKNSMASSNVHDEIYLAKNEKKPLVACLLDDAPFSDEVALFLTKAQHIDARGRSPDDFVRAVTELLNAA